MVKTNSNQGKDFNSFLHLSTMYWYMKTIPMTCHKCQTSFDVPKKEYDRQIRNGRLYFFCSRSCAQSFNKTTTTKISFNCLWCKKEFETTTHKKGKRCCSKNCAHKYAQSHVNSEIHKKSVQRCSEYPKLKEFVCVVCQFPFLRKVKSNVTVKKTCGVKCYSKLLSNLARANPNCGGETNYKRYRYNGILMDSKWEIDLAKWMDENDIVWDRSRKRHQLFWFDEIGNNRRYYPDFYIPKINVYLDPKNPYLMKCDAYKIQKVIERNNVEIICGNLDVLKKTLSERCL